MNKKANYTFFISDLHLSAGNERINAIFFDFLQNTAPKADALYILGDLFKVWAGDDIDSTFYKQVKVALHKVVMKKTPVFLMPGNRDFLLGEVFARESGCILLSDPVVIDLYGRATLLTHGDYLCGKDSLYKWFRNFTAKEKSLKIFFLLPAVIRKFLAHLIHALSCVRRTMLPTKNLIDTIQREANSAMQKYNVDQIIHGHLHRAMLFESYTDNKTTRQIVLGSWDRRGMVLILSKTGQCRMETL